MAASSHEQKMMSNHTILAVYSVADGEQWVIEFLANAIAQRLLAERVGDAYRRTLTRTLSGLQRFPRVTPGLSVTLTWRIRDPDPGEPVGDVIHSVAIGSEDLTISKGHRRLQYFASGSHHLIDFFEVLEEQRRAEFLKDWLREFEGLANPSLPLRIEDLSTGKMSDQPPLSEFWNHDFNDICELELDRWVQR